MGLRFYYGAGSPYAWRVFLALEHKRLPYERVTLSFANRDAQSPDYVRINPRKLVPAIVDGALTLYESAAILEYLEEKYPDSPRLFPAEIEARAVVRRLVREIDTYVGTYISALGKYVFRSQTAARSAYEEGVVEDAAAHIREELGFFEHLLAEDYLAGSMSAADLSLYPLLAMIPRFELRKPDLGMSPHMGPRIQAWMKRIEALPYFDSTYPAHWR